MYACCCSIYEVCMDIELTGSSSDWIERKGIRIASIESTQDASR